MTTETNSLTTIATTTTTDLLYALEGTSYKELTQDLIRGATSSIDYTSTIKHNLLTHDLEYDPIDRCYRKSKANPKVKKVVFNNPATIIFWDDKSKTVVKCQAGDTYDKEKGFVMAYLKKMLGNKNEFNKEIHKWVKEESK